MVKYCVATESGCYAWRHSLNTWTTERGSSGHPSISSPDLYWSLTSFAYVQIKLGSDYRIACRKNSDIRVNMASHLLNSAKNLWSIFPLKGKSVAQMRIASAGRRYLNQEKPISRFPVPIIDTLPQDVQQRMKEVEERVRHLILICSLL